MSQSLLDRAIAHMHQSNWAGASDLLEAALEESPADARVLRLLGTTRFMSDRPQAAIELMTRSLNSDPENSSTHLNLGSVYLALGRMAEALESFQNAVRLDPESSEAYFNLGVAYQQANRLEEARRHYERVLAMDPGFDAAGVNLADIHLLRGDNRRCIDVSTSILEHSPANHWALLARCRAFRQMGHLAEAATDLEEAMTIAPSDPALTVERAGLLAMSGLLEEAIGLLRQVLKDSPEIARAEKELVSALYELGRFDEALEVLNEATDRGPDSAARYSSLGATLQRLGRTDEALAAHQRAVELDGESASAHMAYGSTLLTQGLLDRADAELERAVAIAPMIASAQELRVKVKTAEGNYSEALEMCERYLSTNPSERSMLAAKALLLNELDEQSAARELIDFDRFIKQTAIEAPAGFADLQSFNRALTSHIRGHPSLVHSPESHATRGGMHTGLLLVEPKGPFAAFEGILWDAARAYMESLDIGADHPFLRDPPRLNVIACWSVILPGQGRQIPHIHPSGWLSGVYYAKLPKAVETQGSTQGWIEFGEPPESFVLTKKFPVRTIKPEEGLLVLFPSYFYHRTIPFEGEEERVSIAFDFVPEYAPPESD